MKKLNHWKKTAAIAALVLSGMAVSQARANTIITTTQFFTSPSGQNGTSATYTAGGLSLVASAFNCGAGVLCANNPNHDYSTSTATLYDNTNGTAATNGLGINGDAISIGGVTRQEIPNNEFIQLNLTSILSSNTVTKLVFTFTDIVTAWSLYTSSHAGELEGTGGTQLVNNAGTGTTTFEIDNPTSADDLISVIAGTNCDVVLNSLAITTSTTTQGTVPEPATMLMTGLALLGIGTIVKKTRKNA
jgi:hypothetical protein